MRHFMTTFPRTDASEGVSASIPGNCQTNPTGLLQRYERAVMITALTELFVGFPLGLTSSAHRRFAFGIEFKRSGG